MDKQKDTLKAFLRKAKKNINWKGKALDEIRNEARLERSFAIALAVLTQLKQIGKTQTWLAEQLGCTRQYLSKIVKGKENLTLDTIVKLELALGIELIEVKELDTHSSTTEVY